MAAFDLNLVRVFDALMQQGSVSGAATVLNLTQPAVSNALRRLRDLTSDDLFIRTRRGMEPTPYAVAAADSLAEGLRLIRHGLERAAPFDPKTSRRRFRILMNDAGEMVFLPRLMPHLRREAPGLELQIIQMPYARYLEALETDQVDLAIGSVYPKAGTMVLRRLFDEHYNLVCRPDHPIAQHPGRENMADLTRILAADHVVVRLPAGAESIAETLARLHNLTLRAALEVPHFMVLAGILDQTDLVTIVPRLVAQELGRRANLAILALPFDLPTIRIRLAWHTRQQMDPASRWLRQQIIDLMAAPSRQD